MTLRVCRGLLESLHALASLVPPPLVDLRFAHTRASRDVHYFLTRPEEIARSELALQTRQLLLCLSVALHPASALAPCHDLCITAQISDRPLTVHHLADCLVLGF